jgi:hypothetical protein
MRREMRRHVTREQLFAENKGLVEGLEMIRKMNPAQAEEIDKELDRVFEFHNTMWDLVDEDPEQVLELSMPPQSILADLVVTFITENSAGVEMTPEEVARTGILLGIMLGTVVERRRKSDDDSC